MITEREALKKVADKYKFDVSDLKVNNELSKDLPDTFIIYTKDGSRSIGGYRYLVDKKTGKVGRHSSSVPAFLSVDAFYESEGEDN